uniref:Uncharacterized protein n=1 Tax=Arundo donax TaxID=35708 RepID=A0A0A8Z1P9_ARUDO
MGLLGRPLKSSSQRRPITPLKVTPFGRR